MALIFRIYTCFIFCIAICTGNAFCQSEIPRHLSGMLVFTAEGERDYPYWISIYKDIYSGFGKTKVVVHDYVGAFYSRHIDSLEFETAPSRNKEGFSLRPSRNVFYRNLSGNLKNTGWFDVKKSEINKVIEWTIVWYETAYPIRNEDKIIAQALIQTLPEEHFDQTDFTPLLNETDPYKILDGELDRYAGEMNLFGCGRRREDFFTELFIEKEIQEPNLRRGVVKLYPTNHKDNLDSAGIVFKVYVLQQAPGLVRLETRNYSDIYIQNTRRYFMSNPKAIFNLRLSNQSSLVEGTMRASGLPFSIFNLLYAPDTMNLIARTETLSQKEDPPVEMNPFEKLRSRITDTLHTITINKSKSITLEFYDNATYDGDIISVFINDSLMIHKKVLTTVPLTLNISKEMGDRVTIQVVAENLGTIPPNTAVMVVKYDGNISTYPIKSDLKSNGGVIVQFE